MFTPESLLAIATEAQARYQVLRAEYPPGTYNRERNDAYDVAEKALACAAWLERSGRGSLAFVGPFGTPPFMRGSRVRVRKGAIVHGVKATSGGEPAKTSHVVMVDRVSKGYIWHDGPEGRGAVHQPMVHWAGAGGYWRWVDANDVEPVA